MENKALTYDSVVNLTSVPRQPFENDETYSKRQDRLSLIKDAKLFRIDEMTLDSLMNEPGSFEDFPKFDFKLPFPNIFFEFDSNLGYRFLQDRNNNSGIRIGGVLISSDCGVKKSLDDRVLDIAGFRSDAPLPIVRTHYNEGRGLFYITEYFSGQNKKSVTENNYVLRISNKRLAKINLLEARALRESEDPAFSESEIHKAIEYEKDFEIIDDDYLDAFKLANLVVNTIDYVNAQNVSVREVKRKRNEKVRVGTGKDRHVEKVEVELKPYYWVEVDKTEINKRDNELPEGIHWTLNYRVWVRGHFHRYHSNKGINKKWVQPYVKGPENAPWKNNRYEILYNRFKHLLENKENNLLQQQ